MKSQSRSVCIILSGSILLAATVCAAGSLLPGDLISPQVGSLCNKEANVCYDVYGVSIGITKEIMGQEAADKLNNQISAIDKKYFDQSNFNPAQGISCHTLEKLCYEGDTINDALSTALFGADAGKYGPDALHDVVWMWNTTQYNNDTKIRAKDGHVYRVQFMKAGSIKMKVDCNMAGGNYRAEGKSLTITPGPSTRMACGPDSQDREFLADIEGVAGWLLHKGDLYLDIKFDTGTMNFYRGVVQ